MGVFFSKSSDTRIKNQEAYVKRRMQDHDIKNLSSMQGSFLHGPKAKKYNKKQVKGYLRQEYNGTRKSNAYVSDYSLKKAGVRKP